MTGEEHLKRARAVPASNVSEGLREAVERYIVAMTRRASGGTTDAEVQAAYEALYDAAAAPNDAALAHTAPERLDVERLARVLVCEDPEEPCDADGRGEHRWCDYCIARAVIRRPVVAREYASQPDATEEAGPAPELTETYCVHGIHHTEQCDDCGLGFIVKPPDATEEAERMSGRPAFDRMRGYVEPDVPASNVSEGLREAVDKIANWQTHGPLRERDADAMVELARAALAHAAPERLDVDTLVVNISEAVKRVCLAHGIRPVEFLDAIRTEYARLSQPDATEEAGR